MKRHLFYITIPILVLCGACTACDSPDEESVNSLQLASRVMLETAENSTIEDAPAGTTFRIMTYNSGTLEYVNTGSYIYSPDKDGQYLVPARLDENGNFIEFDESMGADGVNLDADVVLMSPGTTVETTGDNAAIVVCPNRTDAEGNDAGTIYASSIEKMNLSDYSVKSFGDPLREIRSKINFEVRNDEAITDPLVVNSIKVVGAGLGTADERLLYYPRTRQCATPSGIDNVMDFDILDNLTDVEGKRYCRTNTKYVLSAIYAPKSAVAGKLGISSVNKNLLDTNYLTLRINFTQGLRSADAELMLNADADGSLAELLPLHEYTYKIVIASTYIKLYLTIKNHPGNDWQQPDGNHDVSIDDGESILLGAFPINKWNEVIYPDQNF